jgi:hypothetical protein
MRGICVHPWMPDHQILETSQFRASLQNFDLAAFNFDLSPIAAEPSESVSFSEYTG